jgi:hypothetical protein
MDFLVPNKEGYNVKEFQDLPRVARDAIQNSFELVLSKPRRHI